MININKLYKMITKDIMRYGETKDIVVKMQECDNEDIIYEYDLNGDCEKYRLPREEEDGWVYYTVSLSMFETMVRSEIDARKDRVNLIQVI